VMSIAAMATPPPGFDPNVIDPAIWPMTAHRVEGELTVGGISVSELVTAQGSPLYVYDESDLRERARGYRQAFSTASVFYAAKAFLCTTVARWVQEEGLGIDVASGGEMAVALRAGISGDDIILHGNNKSSDEIERAVAARVARIVIDADEEIDRIATAVEGTSVVQDVLLRVTVGVEAHTHEFIATAHEDQKFGFSLASGAALAAAVRIAKTPGLRLRGLHSHIGSQIFDTAGFEVAAHRLVELMATIRDETGVVLEEIDLGGGAGIAYIPGDDPLDVASLARQLLEIVAREANAADLPVPHVCVEPGRAIVGPAGITLYTVGTVKPVALDGGVSRLYVAVDGGMSDNIRTALYDADYTVTVANREVSADTPVVLSRVVGKHCESGDIVVRDCWLPADVRAGDLLAVAATGAYCRSMSSQYNHVPRPAVISVREGQIQTLLRRETEQDLFALEP
jgi:diaminopimelate decarboxylase